jgi:hypothetical protein
MSKLCLSFLPKIVILSKKDGMIDKCDVKLKRSLKFNSQDESNTILSNSSNIFSI